MEALNGHVMNFTGIIVFVSLLLLRRVSVISSILIAKFENVDIC